MQIKTTVRYYLTLVRMAIIFKNLQITDAGEGMEKGEPSYIVGGNVNWCSHCGKLWRLLKKLKIELPDDPKIIIIFCIP